MVSVYRVFDYSHAQPTSAVHLHGVVAAFPVAGGKMMIAEGEKCPITNPNTRSRALNSARAVGNRANASR